MSSKLTDEKLLESIGNTLRALRESKGLTQTEVARQLGVSRPSLTQHEGSNPPQGILLISKLCEFYEVSLTEFFAVVEGNSQTLETLLDEQFEKGLISAIVKELRKGITVNIDLNLLPYLRKKEFQISKRCSILQNKKNEAV